MLSASHWLWAQCRSICAVCGSNERAVVGGSVLLGCVAPTKECAEGLRSYGQSSGDLALYGRAARSKECTQGLWQGRVKIATGVTRHASGRWLVADKSVL